MEIVIRKIDKLGRIVLPMTYRKALGLKENAEIILGMTEDTITIKASEGVCRLCGKEKEAVLGIYICNDCIKKIRNLDI